MQADEPDDAERAAVAASSIACMQETINAMHMEQHSSRAAQGPPQQPQQQRGGRFGGRRGGGRGGMQQLPEALVEQRRKDGVCLKCGDKSHFARGCRNEPRL